MSLSRLQQERLAFRKDHPHGFYAKPQSGDLKVWDCGIVGKANGLWSNGLFPLTIKFPDNYPQDPPEVMFNSPVPHPNIYPNGRVCMSLLGEHYDSNMSVLDILLGVQYLLDNPNPTDAAQLEAMFQFVNDRSAYETTVRKFVCKHQILEEVENNNNKNRVYLC